MQLTMTSVGGRVALAVTVLMAFAGSAAAQSEIVLQASSAPTRAGQWVIATDASAAGGMLIQHPDAGAAKLSAPVASPANYFEITFNAEAGKAYRLWIHGRADDNYWGNDSVFVQFDKSVTSSGSATSRIGTTSGVSVNLEDCSGCGLSGWKWQDNGYGAGVLGSKVYFSTTGTQKMRVQTREDGLAIDQIVLSASTYLNAAPSGLVTATATITPSTTTTTTSISATADIKLSPASAPTRAGKWAVTSDASAIGGASIRHADAGAAKITAALASPSNYFEMTFEAVANTPYRLWIHGRADNDYWSNDSVFVQFDKSVTSTGSATYRIGTTAATEVNLEDCSGCGLSGWKWQDNGYGSGVLGAKIYFATTGTQKIRVQTREDGLAIDQILLSPLTYLTTAPPATGSTTTTAPAPAPDPTPEPTPTTPTTTTLKMLHWNIHHGVRTDGVCDLDLIASWIVKTGANVVSLNEVEKFKGWCNNADEPAVIVSLLKSKTGKAWYYNFAEINGNTNGQGNMVISTFPIESQGDYVLSASRSVARVQVMVGATRVNVFSTHLDDSSSSTRITQMKELIGWASTYSQQWIVAGDFNAWPGTTEITNMTAGFYDSWAKAAAMGTAIAYAGNEAGNTRNSRIDYVWYSKYATSLVLKEARVYDTRNSSGVMPSDHRPLMVTYQVK